MSLRSADSLLPPSVHVQRTGPTPATSHAGLAPLPTEPSAAAVPSRPPFPGSAPSPQPVASMASRTSSADTLPVRVDTPSVETAPLPIVQRKEAELVPMAIPSAQPGVSFAEMFAPAQQAAATGSTTVPLTPAESFSNPTTEQRPIDSSLQRSGKADPRPAPVVERGAAAGSPQDQHGGFPQADPDSGPPYGSTPPRDDDLDRQDLDVDALARRLFEPLSARLRAELWLDRERAGLVSDARL